MDLAGENVSRSVAKYIRETCKRLRYHGILSLLILPIQRMPRYLLLLESLHKHTPDLHIYLRRLENTLQKLLGVTKKVDECQRQSDNSLKMFSLQKQLNGAPSDFQILSPSREFIRQGKVQMVIADRLGGSIDVSKWSEVPTYNIVLFNDLMVIIGNKYTYVKHFLLHDVTIKECANTSTHWDVYTGSPELLYGRIAFRSAALCEKWSSIMYHTINKAKTTYSQHLIAKNQSRCKTLSDKDIKTSVIDHVNVFLRIRPFVTTEEKELNEKCLTTEDDNVAVLARPEGSGMGVLGKNRTRDKVGIYDHVFSERDSQAAVFKRVGEEVLGSVFCGYNCAIIAYGNTGSGKTHTIMGEEKHNRGLAPRVLEQLFSILKQNSWKHGSKIQVSYVQIYCNKLYDLQGTDKHTLRSLKIVKRGDIHEVAGVTKATITSAEQALYIIEQGNRKRVTRAHKMNDASSR